MPVDSMNDAVWSAIVLLLGGVLCIVVGRSVRVHPFAAALLFFWHSCWATFYDSYVLNNGGDAFYYFQHARFDFVEFGFGTDFINWLTSFGTSLGLGYWPISFLYNTAGAAGLILFYAALRESAEPAQDSRLVKLVILVSALMPSLSFWTAGIGKDSIALLSVGLFAWSTMRFDRRQLAAAAAVVIMFLPRPHIAVLMVLSVAAGVVFVKRLRATVRFGMATIAVAAASFAVPFALLYSGVGRFFTIGDFISDRQEHNMGGGSSIDITGMNPLFRLLSYLYRPLPMETDGFQQFAASIDNVVLIGLTVLGLIGIVRAGWTRVFRSDSIALLYGLACSVLLSQVTANLGLGMRQKWMALPALLLVTVSAWSALRERQASLGPMVRPLGEPQGAR